MRRLGLLTLLAGSLGGCLRLTGSSRPTATPDGEPTVTPAAVTTAVPADSDERNTAAPTQTPESDLDFPTGLSPDGVDSFLVDNHVNTLADTTFTEVFQSNLVTTGDTMVNRRTQIGDGIALTTRGMEVGSRCSARARQSSGGRTSATDSL